MMFSFPQTMRAVLLRDGKGDASALNLGDAPRTAPISVQVLVQIRAFVLNRIDIIKLNSMYLSASEILGGELAGTVTHVEPPPAEGGDGAEPTALPAAIGRWKEGAEVFGLAYGGAYAEYIVSPATHLIPKPASLSFVDAASIPEVWLTAYQALIVQYNVQQVVVQLQSLELRVLSCLCAQRAAYSQRIHSSNIPLQCTL